MAETLVALLSKRAMEISIIRVSTALTYDMKLIGEQTKLNFAVLPIGDFFTMGVDDALRAADFVGATKIVGVHYDTFPPIKIDRETALKAARAAGKELLLPKIGETISL